MIKNVKIHGAGSIGNHLAQASRTLGWNVVVTDVSPDALKRMREEIYPSRYGRWDETIQLFLSSEAPKGGFDLICIGTPPEVHLPLAQDALAEKPAAILIEKPACPPSMEGAQHLIDSARATGTKLFIGYDHVVGKAALRVEELMREKAVGEVQTIDVDFREHWQGIFKAHPWLSGPEDTYLGFWRRGGGASGEHSHALNLWQHLAHVAGVGRVVELDAMLAYTSEGRASYDTMCAWNLLTDRGLVGRVVQDVVTLPSRKRAVVQGTEGSLEWVNGYSPEGDGVLVHRPGKAPEVQVLPKKRPDDFILELSHIASSVEGKIAASPLALERGLDTALVVAAAHKAHEGKRRVSIDWSRGYSLDALK